MSGTEAAAAPDDDAADRIERALERIAALRAQDVRGTQAAPEAANGPELDPTLGLRLDHVIAQLREALGH